MYVQIICLWKEKERERKRKTEKERERESQQGARRKGVRKGELHGLINV